MDDIDMRKTLVQAYPPKTPKGKEWEKKVHKMPRNQVLAIYLRIQAQKRKSQRRREWQEIPIYVPNIPV